MSTPRTFGWYRPWLIDLQASAHSKAAKGIGAVLATSEWHGVVRAILALPTAGDDLRDAVEQTARISALASCDPSTSRRALDELRDGGWISHRRRRNYVEVRLLPRTGTTPVPKPENEHHAVSRTGIGPDRNRDDVDSGTGTTPVAYETSTHSSTSSTAPQPPASGGLVLPNRPIGNRQRTIAAWEAEISATVLALADELFPDVADRQAACGYVEDALNRLKRSGVGDPTPDAVFALAAPYLEPEAAA